MMLPVPCCIWESSTYNESILPANSVIRRSLGFKLILKFSGTLRAFFVWFLEMGYRVVVPILRRFSTSEGEWRRTDGSTLVRLALMNSSVIVSALSAIGVLTPESIRGILSFMGMSVRYVF